MKNLAEFFYDRSGLLVSIILTIAMGTYAALVMGGQSECFQEQLDEGVKVFGLTFGLSKEYALALFQSLNIEGLMCYKRLMLIWDNIFPVLYCLMYVSWLSFLLRDILPKSVNIRIINIYPILPAFLDWIENIFEVRMVNYFIDNADISNFDLTINNIVSQLKWISSYLNYLVIISAIVLFVYTKIKGRD